MAGAISAAEEAIWRLDDVAQPGLEPLARLLLRSESIASSKVEGIRMDARAIALAEARSDLGNKVGTDSAEILANIDAMQLASREGREGDWLRVFANAAARAADLAAAHLVEVQRLQARWRDQLASQTAQ